MTFNPDGTPRNEITRVYNEYMITAWFAKNADTDPDSPGQRFWKPALRWAAVSPGSTESGSKRSRRCRCCLVPTIFRRCSRCAPCSTRTAGRTPTRYSLTASPVSRFGCRKGKCLCDSVPFRPVPKGRRRRETGSHVPEILQAFDDLLFLFRGFYVFGCMRKTLSYQQCQE